MTLINNQKIIDFKIADGACYVLTDKGNIYRKYINSETFEVVALSKFDKVDNPLDVTKPKRKLLNKIKSIFVKKVE